MINSVIAGVQLRTLRVAGAPVAGTDEVQTLQHSGTVSGGTFKLYFPGINGVPGGETSALAYNANAATVQAALEAVVGSGNLTCSGTLSGGMTVTGAAKLAKLALPALQLRENLLT